MENTIHLDNELLERYALRKLTEDQEAPVEEHLLICHTCQDRLAEADEYIHTFRAAAAKLAAETEKAVEPKKGWALPRFFQIPKLVWVPALAAVAVIAIVVQTPSSYNQTQTVYLRAMRSSDSAPVAEAGARLDLRLGTEGLQPGMPYRVEIANEKGTAVWYGVVTWKDGLATVSVPKLLVKGQYWVRLFEAQPDSEMVREFSLAVQ